MNPRLARAPFVLLGLMTVLTVGGPLAISRTIRGGRSPAWPPDRPAEWWTFGLVVGAFVILMTACLALGLANWRRTLAEASDRDTPAGPRRRPTTGPPSSTDGPDARAASG